MWHAKMPDIDKQRDKVDCRYIRREIIYMNLDCISLINEITFNFLSFSSSFYLSIFALFVSLFSLYLSFHFDDFIILYYTTITSSEEMRDDRRNETTIKTPIYLFIYSSVRFDYATHNGSTTVQFSKERAKS